MILSQTADYEICHLGKQCNKDIKKLMGRVPLISSNIIDSGRDNNKRYGALVAVMDGLSRSIIADLLNTKTAQSRTTTQTMLVRDVGCEEVESSIARSSDDGTGTTFTVEREEDAPISLDKIIKEPLAVIRGISFEVTDVSEAEL